MIDSQTRRYELALSLLGKLESIVVVAEACLYIVIILIFIHVKY